MSSLNPLIPTSARNSALNCSLNPSNSLFSSPLNSPFTSPKRVSNPAPASCSTELRGSGRLCLQRRYSSTTLQAAIITVAHAVRVP
ncbi:hypothetical protein FQN51_008032 [Onygenales sp. PD_10]|nr:hypothetical protein FQN51_008032 [Onygenales sp. PD_10]